MKVRPCFVHAWCITRAFRKRRQDVPSPIYYLRVPFVISWDRCYTSTRIHNHNHVCVLFPADSARRSETGVCSESNFNLDQRTKTLIWKVVVFSSNSRSISAEGLHIGCKNFHVQTFNQTINATYHFNSLIIQPLRRISVIYVIIDGPTVHCWALAAFFFQFLDLIYYL
jgi:hypothetical protein